MGVEFHSQFCLLSLNNLYGTGTSLLWNRRLSDSRNNDSVCFLNEIFAEISEIFELEFVWQEDTTAPESHHSTSRTGQTNHLFHWRSAFRLRTGSKTAPFKSIQVCTLFWTLSLCVCIRDVIQQRVQVVIWGSVARTQGVWAKECKEFTSWNLYWFSFSFFMMSTLTYVFKKHLCFMFMFTELSLSQSVMHTPTCEDSELNHWFVTNMFVKQTIQIFLPGVACYTLMKTEIWSFVFVFLSLWQPARQAESFGIFKVWSYQFFKLSCC